MNNQPSITIETTTLEIDNIMAISTLLHDLLSGGYQYQLELKLFRHELEEEDPPF